MNSRKKKKREWEGLRLCLFVCFKENFLYHGNVQHMNVLPVGHFG